MATVVVPYNEWVGYNVLKYLSKYPLVSSAVLAALSSGIIYTVMMMRQGKEKGMKSLVSFLVIFLVSYAILWYYGTTLFSET